MGANDRKFYLAVLNSEECQCESPKKRGNAFCFKCFIALPLDDRDALYQHIGCGFGQAYDNACKYLND